MPASGASTNGTIAAVLAGAAARLQQAGCESSRLDAEVLLAHVLGVDRPHLLAHPDRPLSASERARFDGLIARRARGEPVAYLTGRRDWYDLTLRVTPDVLVPRPETEGLLERALAWAREHPVQAAADIGTGAGALAIALARALPGICLYATDLSPRALAVARANAASWDVADAITFMQGDLLDALPGPVDLIVANLPYMGAEEYNGLMRDVRLYEPREALVGGLRGQELLERLLLMAPRYLRPGGALFAELGPPQGQPALEAARSAFPSAAAWLERDYAGLVRYLIVDTASSRG